MRQLMVMVIIGTQLYSCMPDNFVEFKPVVRENDRLIYTDISHFPQSFPERMSEVLRYYRESYQLDAEGKILIKTDLLNNKELLWNYTNKAVDEEWLNSHVN